MSITGRDWILKSDGRATIARHAPLTLIEQLVARVPLPYLLSVLILSSVLGVPGMLLTRYLDTLDLNVALQIFGPLAWSNIITFSLANLVLTIYALYGIWFMRSRTQTAVSTLSRLVPEGEERVREIFRPTSLVLPPIMLGAVLTVISFVSFPDQAWIAGPLSLALRLVGYPVVYLSYGTFVWVYLSSIRSLHQLGKEPLQLRSYLEDSHLGLKPFGSLSLSLALVYFLGMGLVFFSFLSIPTLLLLVLAALIIAGTALFFLPLLAIHSRMREKKCAALEALSSQFNKVTESIAHGENSIEGTVRNVGNLVALDLAERRIASVSEWPLDSPTLSWFSFTVFSVMAAIVTRYVLLSLGL